MAPALFLSLKATSAACQFPEAQQLCRRIVRQSVSAMPGLHLPSEMSHVFVSSCHRAMLFQRPRLLTAAVTINLVVHPT